MSEIVKAKKAGKVVLNVDPSPNPELNWGLAEADEDSLLVTSNRKLPDWYSLIRPWWKIQNQGQTGACVGYSMAYGLQWFHFVEDKGWDPRVLPSARFIWMASKETDPLTSLPTTFLDSAGTYLKSALDVARKLGATEDTRLPMEPRSLIENPRQFYLRSAENRISAYYDLGVHDDAAMQNWKRWIVDNGPIMVHLRPDWQFFDPKQAVLKEHKGEAVKAGHAVVIVAYSKAGFVIRNSWGDKWGMQGYIVVSEEWAKRGIVEAFGVHP